LSLIFEQSLRKNLLSFHFFQMITAKDAKRQCKVSDGNILKVVHCYIEKIFFVYFVLKRFNHKVYDLYLSF